MAEWTFGNFLASSFADEEQTGYTELDPDAGKPYRREMFTDIGNIVAGTVTLELQDYITFKDWYRNTIRQGSIEFDFYDCRVSQTRTALMIGKPSYVTNDRFYNVSVQLYLEPVTAYLDWNLLTEAGEQLIVSTEVIV